MVRDMISVSQMSKVKLGSCVQGFGTAAYMLQVLLHKMRALGTRGGAKPPEEWRPWKAPEYAEPSIRCERKRRKGVRSRDVPKSVKGNNR